MATRAGVSAVAGGPQEPDPLQHGLEPLGLRALHGAPDGLAPALSDRPAIRVHRATPGAVRALLASPPGTVDRVPAAAALPPGAEAAFEPGEEIPVLLWGAGARRDGPIAEMEPDGGVVFHADIVTASALLLSRWEETAQAGVQPEDLDEYGRFPATASLAWRQGFLDRPLVDDYAWVLRAWLRHLNPAWRPPAPRLRVTLSCDIDHLRDVPSATVALRTLGHHWLRRRDLRGGLRHLHRVLRQLRSPSLTDAYTGVLRLADIADELGLAPVHYYVLATGRGARDADYDLDEPAVTALIHHLAARGHPIDLHAGYDSIEAPEDHAAQRARLAELLPGRGFGVRQHYLRFRAPDTWRRQVAAGLRHDATLGFGDHEGFRCGTGHAYPVFDLQADGLLALEERPLLVMDVTLRRRELGPEQACACIRHLAERCARRGGTLSLLWHNSSLDEDWRAWMPHVKATLADILRRHPATSR